MMDRARVALAMAVMALASCTGIQVALDRSGLEDMAEELASAGPAGDPLALGALVASHDLARDTKPMTGDMRDEGPLEDWAIELSDGTEVVPRLLRFTSLLQRADQPDSGALYLYETGPGERAIVWAPGMGFTDSALPFIDGFFSAALERGWSVAVWVPPYHQERRARGRDSGEGFLTADPAANIQLVLAGVRELRTTTAWLRSRGATRIGAWGGSMGAAMLLLAASVEPLDHVSLMIPVLDWRVVALEHELMAPAVTHLTRAGYDLPLLRDAYALLSPVEHELRVPPSRVQILYARHDQLTPETTTRAYAAARNIETVHAYEHSHATILLSDDIDDDYREFLGDQE